MTMVDPMKPVKPQEPRVHRPIPAVPRSLEPHAIPPSREKATPIKKKRSVPWHVILLGMMSASLLVLPELMGQLIIIVFDLAAKILSHRDAPRSRAAGDLCLSFRCHENGDTLGLHELSPSHDLIM